MFSTGRLATGTTRGLAVTFTYQSEYCPRFTFFTFPARFAVERKMKILSNFYSALSENYYDFDYLVLRHVKKMDWILRII